MPFRSNKPARLEKQRTNDQPGSKFPPARYDDSDDTSLRSPNRYSIQSLSHQQLVTRQRQLLLRQFSDTSDSSKNGQDRLGRSTFSDQYGDPKASTSTVNTIVNDIEARTKIDVEQAIGLLQELKKIASPDELVALHRALLPVKEDTTVAQRPSIEERAYTSVPPERRRSVMPPGLATRSGISEDVLRKPSDSSSEATPTNSRRETWILETPKQQPRNDSPSRLSTRSEQAYCHAGAYASGTLRITNGAASPEPSIISKLALESNDAEEAKIDPPAVNDVEARPSFQSLRERRSEDSGSPRARRSPIKQQNPEVPRPAGPRPGSLDFHSRERAKARTELRLDPPLQRHSFQHIPDPASEDVPRFQQRWGHRAAFLSQEYALDCEITESPYEEQNGLVDFAKRLSTVHDDGESEAGDDDDADSRADALSRLTGVLEEGETGIIPSDIGTARTSDEADSSPQTIAATQDKVVRKVDSGYCSDASTAALQRKSSAEAGKPKNAPAIQEQPGSFDHGNNPRGPESRLPADTCDGTNDTSSLLTFEEMVSSSPQTEAASTSSPSQTTKKSPLSLFKSKSKATRKSSFTVLNVYHGDRPKTSDGLDDVSSAQPSPPPSRSGPADRSKKLQKPMPEAVRRQRKKTMENLKASMSEHSPTVQNLLADEPAKQDNSDCFIGCQPKDAIEDGEQADSKAKSLRQRSKSFVGRKRSKTVGESQEDSTQSSTSLAPSRKRSKSHADRTPPIPVDDSVDASSSLNCLRSAEPDTPARDRPVPMHMDFASVARSLQSQPPDPSNNAHRSAPVPKRSSMQRYYSLHKIVTDTDHLDAKETQESRQEAQPGNGAPTTHDVNKSVDERTTVPSTHHVASSAPSSTPTNPVAVGSRYSVEDRFPGWQGKPASPNATPPQTPLHSPSSSASWLPIRHNRSQSVLAAGIPPLPELPADIAAKVSRADQMVAKKLRLSPRSSPSGSARNSIDSGVDTRKQLLAKKAEARKEQDGDRSKDARQLALDQLNVPREEDEEASDRSTADSARWSVDGSIQLPRPEEQPLPASPTHDSQHPGWPGWEQQSNLWRQRREALVQSLEADNTPAQETSEQSCESPSTPGIVVSRYITPLGAENAHNANRMSQSENDSAKKYADEYTSLIEDDKENTPSRPTAPRADSVVSTATFVTMQSTDDRALPVDGSRPNSALSSYTTTTTVSSTTSWSNGPSSRSPFNRDRQQYMRTKSGHFLPYRPSDASHAERSRALSLARRSCQMASSESLNIPPQRPELKKSSSESLFDRYGGGMQYGWDRNSGSFGGSAGTRSKIDTECKENRKSVKMSEDFGLDLSDIPVFLRKESSFSTMHHG